MSNKKIEVVLSSDDLLRILQKIHKTAFSDKEFSEEIEGKTFETPEGIEFIIVAVRDSYNKTKELIQTVAITATIFCVSVDIGIKYKLKQDKEEYCLQVNTGSRIMSPDNEMKASVEISEYFPDSNLSDDLITSVIGINAKRIVVSALMQLKNFVMSCKMQDNKKEGE